MSKKEKEDRMMELCRHMIKRGKVVVKDKADKTVKESTITAVYCDGTVTLPDCIHCDYDVFDVTIIPVDKRIDEPFIY